MQQRLIYFPDRDDVIRVAKVAGQLFRVADRMSARIGGRQQDSPNIIGAQGFASQGKRDSAAAGGPAAFRIQRA